MSTYVGWCWWGDVQFFDGSTEETTSHKIGYVDSDLSALDAALDKLQSIVRAADVKQLVFVYGNYSIKSCDLFVKKLTEKGFKSVYIQHWISNELQMMLLEQKVEFTEGQYFLLAILCGNECLMLWRFHNGRIEFVKIGLEIKTNHTSSHFRDTIQLFDDFNIALLLKRGANHISDMVKRLFPECKIVDRATNVTANDFTATALWTAKRQDGLVDGVEVGNFCCIGPEIRIGNTMILDKKSDGIPLPFDWTSEWELYKFDTTASITFDDCDYKLQLPANRTCRINVKIDKNGSHEIYVELKCTLGISLSQDSFYLVRSSDSVDGGTVSIGEFPTALRFDCDPPKLTSVCGENVIDDSIKMLDPDQEPKNGWKYIRNLEDTVELCKLVQSPEEAKVVTASYVVSEVLKNIKSMATNVLLDSNVCVALSRFLTQKQREKLTNILKLKQPEIDFIDEIQAATFGFSVEKARPDGVTLVVDLRTTGCVFSLFRIKDNCCKLLVQQEFTDLKSENVRQAMQVVFASRNFTDEKCDETKAEMNEMISQFREAVSAVVGTEEVNVKNVLLIGSSHLVPNFTEHFTWLFIHGNVALLEESEWSRFAAVGSILLHFNTLNTDNRRPDDRQN